MNKKTLFRLATVSGITIGSFLTGISYERKRCISKLNESNNPYLLYASDDIKKVRESLFCEFKIIFSIRKKKKKL